jgi:hypothetical protein
MDVIKALVFYFERNHKAKKPTFERVILCLTPFEPK